MLIELSFIKIGLKWSNFCQKNKTKINEKTKTSETALPLQISGSATGFKWIDSKRLKKRENFLLARKHNLLVNIVLMKIWGRKLPRTIYIQIFNSLKNVSTFKANNEFCSKSFTPWNKAAFELCKVHVASYFFGLVKYSSGRFLVLLKITDSFVMTPPPPPLLTRQLETSASFQWLNFSFLIDFVLLKAVNHPANYGSL